MVGNIAVQRYQLASPPLLVVGYYIEGVENKKKSFLLPLATALVALAGASVAPAQATQTSPVVTNTKADPAFSIPKSVPEDLVIQRPAVSATKFAQHRSHSSHSSHRSHYSSR
jgi:hypothetical protein